MHSNFVLHLPNEILAIIINELALDNEDIDIDNDNDNDKSLAALASCRLASHIHIRTEATGEPAFLWNERQN